MSFEWTELAFLELEAGNTAMLVFAFSIMMVFLVLAAQFESWSMPLAVILSVPLCVSSALVGLNLAKLIEYLPPLHRLLVALNQLPAQWRSTSSRRSGWWCWWVWRARTRS